MMPGSSREDEEIAILPPNKAEWSQDMREHFEKQSWIVKRMIEIGTRMPRLMRWILTPVLANEERKRTGRNKHLANDRERDDGG
jgi:hypothetical protein